MSDTYIDPAASPDTPALPPGDAAVDKPPDTAFDRAAQHTRRSNIRPGGLHPLSPEADPVAVTDEATYEAVPAGNKYRTPDGQVRSKPVRTPDDYAKLPEGRTYFDPDGNQRVKPKAEPIDFTAETLYQMSITPSEKRKALERSYPGKVKEDLEGLYVDDDGKLRRPGRGMVTPGAFVTAATAPAVGATAGFLLGNLPGGAVGAIAGQGVNDIVLQLAGVYDRSIGEEVLNLGLAGATSVGGAVVGKGVAAAVPAVKAGVSKVSQMLPATAANFLGAGPELTMARQLAEKGVQVPPSVWAHEAPHLQNIVEVFDPAFRTNKPLLQSATQHYEKQATTILEDLGVKPTGSLVKPTADVPTKQAGERILQNTLAKSQQADEALRVALDARKASLAAGLPDTQAQRETILKAAEQSRVEAQKLIDMGFKKIEEQTNQAMTLARANTNTGELWENIGKQLQDVKRGFMARAKTMYDEADQIAGTNLPRAEGLSDIAEQFINQLPGDFKAKHPDVVQKLINLAGVKNEAGEWVKEPVQQTFGQLHNLRSLLRGNADWYTLSSDIRNGTYKFFSNKVDAVLHDAKAVPELKAAAQALDRADEFYRNNIGIFDAQQIKTIMKGLEVGEFADPVNLYKAVVREGQTDLTKRIRDMVGPNLWAGVRAADTKAMLDASKTLNPGEIDGRAFAREVLGRWRDGTLEVVHGKTVTEQLLKQARAIEQLEGRLPIPTRPDDTLTQAIARARLAADEAKALGSRDPIGMLNREMKLIETDHQKKLAAAKRERRSDPLGFLYEPTTGASQAVEKILANEDLLLASAARFGEKSPEFTMLRQIYVERLLRGTLEPGKRLEAVSPEIQQLMFPGVSLNQMQVLAKEMSLLMERRGMARSTAGGMSAMSKVEHPVAGALVSRVTKMIPGVNPGARAMLGKYYSTITDLMTSPATLRWIEKGLTKGTPEEQEAVREVLRRHLQKGGAVGAAVGESLYQQPQP